MGVAYCYLRITANPGEVLGLANLIDQMPCHAPAYWLATESGFGLPAARSSARNLCRVYLS
jgi:hypothetical protein